MPQLAVRPSHPALQAAAAALAQQLNLPLYHPELAVELVLLLSDERLELQEQRKQGARLAVDFVAGKAGYRRRSGGGKQQALVRAIGLRREALQVLDATAGLGYDAFVLASVGCQLRLCERNPVVASLLADGLRRARAHPDTAAIATAMQLEPHDARTHLAHLSQNPADHPDVVYIDPMYPHSGKSAGKQKGMQLLRWLSGDDDDASELLEPALAVARQRVVVKRPRNAPALSNRAAHACIETKNTRFDLYFPAQR